MDTSFRRLAFSERLDYLKHHCALDDDELAILSGQPLSNQIAENLIENAIGYFPIPMGIATHFLIDGRERLIPMAVEETSIIAAASATAKWIKKQGSIRTRALGRLIIGQIQLPQVKDIGKTKAALEAQGAGLIAAANEFLPGLVRRGGGVRDIIFRELDREDNGKMLVVHVLCDPCDAMGANLINQVCEAMKPQIEMLTDEPVGLCILSNLVDGKLVEAEVVIRGIDPKLGEGIQEATLFAQADPYRAATHNKGVLNGIDPILIATGNDWRAVEAGVHAFASRSGRYRPVTNWKLVGTELHGRIEIPLAVGTVGGVTKIHPVAKVAMKILGIERAEDLARICAAVGLVQNLGALRALSTVGIVRGHMELHAANLALAAGSSAEEVPKVRRRLAEILKTGRSIGIQLAQEILNEVRLQAASEHQH